MSDPGNYYNRVHVRKDKSNARRLAFLTILLFAAPPGWPLFAVGILLVLSGVMLHGWAAGYLARAGYAERDKILTVRGPYRHNRNPYYVAQLTMDLGFFFLAGQPMLYIFYFPVIFFIYRRWLVLEEGFLEHEFGAHYLDFKNEVPRWRFRLKARAGRGSELNFSWATFKLNRELARSLSHLWLLAVFAIFFVFGNPLSEVGALLKISPIAAIAVWLILHDIYPLDVSNKSLGWYLFAASTGVFTILFLLHAPVWQAWSGIAAWVSVGAGICLGLVAWVAALPGRPGSTDKPHSLLARPICHWYLFALSFGLMSCTLGGQWVAMMLPLIGWALQFGGGLSIPEVPRRPVVSFALAALLVAAGGFSVAQYLI